MPLDELGAERVFGYAAGEIHGKPLDVLLPSRSFQDHGGDMVEFAPSAQASRMPQREIGARFAYPRYRASHTS